MRNVDCFTHIRIHAYMSDLVIYRWFAVTARLFHAWQVRAGCLFFAWFKGQNATISPLGSIRPARRAEGLKSAILRFCGAVRLASKQECEKRRSDTTRRASKRE